MKASKTILRFLFGLLFSTAGFAQSDRLAIDRNAGPVRVGITGVTGQEYFLEGAPDLNSLTNWQFLLSLTLTNGSQNWFDSESALGVSRFYRLARPASPTPPALAPDFRLIDHLGKSRELYYYTNRAVVLIFTGNGCARIQELLPTIKSLRDQFAFRGVLFWMIDSNSGDTRSSILAEATALGIDLPILHDEAQLVAGEYQAAKTPEVCAVDTSARTLFYRGAIDDRTGSTAETTTQNYLADALANFLAGSTVTPSQTVPRGCAIDLSPPLTASYATNIAPLLIDKCVRCHSPGNIAPWAMTNYTIVRSYASLIKAEVMANRMPPWHADPHYSVFANDAALKPDEARALIQWINDGAPRGSGPDPLAVAPPPPTNYPFAWPASLGQPDFVLSIPPQSIPATGVVDYRYVNVTTTFPTDTWIRAAVVRPGNRKIVHHCLVFFGSDSIFKGLLGFFAGYVPGYDPVASPDGTAKLLPRGTVLQFQMHYITSGQPETDQTEIGLYLSPTPPTRVLQTKSAPNISFSIPPNSPETQTNATYTFAKDSLLYEMAPHMHMRGSWFRYEAVYPDNTREILLSVPHYEFHWQTLYRLAQPKFMPAGTRLLCTGAWDNTEQNAALMEQFITSGGDPNFSPDQTVTFGEQTYNEMFIGYFNFAELP